MKESFFQFSKPVLKSMDFNVNPSFKNTETIDIKHNVSSEITRDTTNSAKVLSTMTIGDDIDAPFMITVSIESEFTWSNDHNDINIDKVLKQNSIALLLSYTRPLIMIVTGYSEYPAMNIPFMDLTEEEEEDK